MLSQPGDHGCGFPGGSVVKNLPASAGDTGSIPGQEDPLEKEMATHSSTLSWRSPWTEEPGGQQSMGSQRVGHNLATKHTCICVYNFRSLENHSSCIIILYFNPLM